MTETVTVTLSAQERDQLVRGLVLLMEASERMTEILPAGRSLLTKLASAGPGPFITVGVHGGQVQWVLGNPFPVRVCDFDGVDEALPDIDELDQKCRMWLEPIDEKWSNARWRCKPW